MIKDPLIYLKHILECIDLIETYLKGISKEAFYDDLVKKDAVARRLEIIGEAARNIPVSFKAKHPKIKWRDIVDFRNILIHEYDGLDYDIIWNIATKKIHDLKKQILKIKKDLKKRA